MLIDTHAHLEAIEDLKGSLKRAKEAGVTKIITIGTSLKTSKKAVEIAHSTSPVRLRSGLRGASENIPEIFAACGIHPQDGKDEVEKLGLYQCINTLKQIAESSNRVVAIGECGLDYYLDGEKRIATVDKQSLRSSSFDKLRTAGLKDKKFQRELFEAQINLAQELKLPLVIHCRNAWDEIIQIISKFKVQNSKLIGVFHSWTGDWHAAKRALDLGFYISFSGIVTFRNASEIQEVAKQTPLDRILVETDSPFLSPHPLRGKQNEPKNVRIVGKFLADLCSLPFDKIAEASTQNARSLFGI